MKKRVRPNKMTTYFTDAELAEVKQKMMESGCVNFSYFSRQMLLTGEVKHYDFFYLKEFSASLGRIAGSMNQIARRCNENRSIYLEDVEQLRDDYLKVKAICQERIIKFLRRL